MFLHTKFDLFNPYIESAHHSETSAFTWMQLGYPPLIFHINGHFIYVIIWKSPQFHYILQSKIFMRLSV